MAKGKFDPAVYAALHNAGFSKREIARLLGVNEASVRRGLKHNPPRSVRVLLTELADALDAKV